MIPIRKLKWTSCLLFACMLAGCSQKAAELPPNPAVPVLVAKAVEKQVPLELHAIGTGVAVATITVKPQISGQLFEVHFHEGQFVRKGELLFTIDPRPFQASLDQAQGALLKDKAQAANAEVQSSRYARLYEEGVAAKEQYDTISTSAAALQAAVKADEAAVEYARLQLEFCKIYSPIDGMTGNLMVQAGNMVKANDVPVLITINQITPIYVDFTLAEQYLAEVKKYMATGRLPVQAYLPDDAQHPETGYLSFVDNTVDFTTGTIRFKGTFANSGHRLWPGQFLNVVLRLAEQANAIVVPSQAVQTGQNGSFVFVLKSDMTVESRPVTVGRTVGGEAILEKGVQAGETVVTDGQLRLVPKGKVQIKSSL
jgi:membrane fusion protein, multidrug efflux system